MSSQATTSQRLRPFKPQRFGRYTLLMPISVGGMGEIFLARLEGAQGFEKLCVIKKILPHLAEDQAFVARFVDEGRTLVKLHHGSVAQVLDMGVQEGAPYLALEHVDGKDLRRVAARMRERRLTLPITFALYVMSRVLDALAYAHRKRGDDEEELNLVHRDVSPQNVLISYEGEVKVIDFGLAKSTLSSAKTNPAIVLGKFLYMSPEQARHQRVDRRSDLYAVGLCLYELVTGKNPFEDVPPGELMARVANPSIAPLAEVEPLCPPALSEVVMKALHPEPGSRPQTAEELRGKLQAILLELDPGAGPETASRLMREAFSAEYQAERKLLAQLREQAKQIADGGGSGSPARAALSFTPTRKEVGSGGPDFEQETLPDISVAPAPGRLVKSRDTEPTEAMAATLPPVEEAAAGLGALLGKPLLPSPVGRLRTVPEVPAEPTPAPRAERPEKRKAAARAQARTPPRPSRATAGVAPEDPPIVAGELEASVPAPPQNPKSAGWLIWLVLPLMAVLAVAGYIAWDQYADRVKQQALEAEARRDAETQQALDTHRSREVKVEPPPEKEPDELAPLPKEAPRKKPPAPVKVAGPALTPTQKLMKELDAQYQRLPEGQGGAFKLQLNLLRDKVSRSPEDGALTAELEKMREKMEAAGAAP